jgi:hypothetical protein
VIATASGGVFPRTDTFGISAFVSTSIPTTPGKPSKPPASTKRASGVTARAVTVTPGRVTGGLARWLVVSTT